MRLAGNAERIYAYRRSIRKLGDWTNKSHLQVSALKGSVILDLLLPDIEPGDITVELDIEGSTVILLVPDGAIIDARELRRHGRGRIKDRTGAGSPQGRVIRLVGTMRSAEVRIHRGGVARFRLLLSRSARGQVREARRAGRV